MYNEKEFTSTRVTSICSFSTYGRIIITYYCNAIWATRVESKSLELFSGVMCSTSAI